VIQMHRGARTVRSRRWRDGLESSLVPGRGSPDPGVVPGVTGPSDTRQGVSSTQSGSQTRDRELLCAQSGSGPGSHPAVRDRSHSATSLSTVNGSHERRSGSHTSRTWERPVGTQERVTVSRESSERRCRLPGVIGRAARAHRSARLRCIRRTVRHCSCTQRARPLFFGDVGASCGSRFATDHSRLRPACGPEKCVCVEILMRDAGMCRCGLRRGRVGMGGRRDLMAAWGHWACELRGVRVRASPRCRAAHAPPALRPERHLRGRPTSGSVTWAQWIPAAQGVEPAVRGRGGSGLP
jgi:hypothetical protein